jgi:NADH-quinone oxidoreductase subunit M
MFMNSHILTLILFVPLTGAGVLALLPATGKTQQWGALAITLLTFLLTLHLPYWYNYAAGGMQFETNHLWIAAPSIHYHIAVDGLSLWLVVLTGLLAPLGVLISWKAIDTRAKEFYVLFLVQQTAMFGVFVTLDLFLYYGFWELSLVPMTILIAVFGRTENRRKAAMKYFLYTFLTSALLLVAILWLYARTGTFDFTVLAQLAAAHAISPSHCALWLASLAFLVAFAVKVPVFPLHGWLSDAISEAPTAAVMVLAGKLGLYSILRFSLGIFPAESHRIAPLMIALGAIGILYGSLIALVQTDMKRLAAYSTLGHLSFCILGIFSFTIAGMDGGIYQILNHGISGGALFMLMGMLYERYRTYDMRDLGGIAQKMPWMVTLFVITTLSLIGLPILNGFVGEFLILSGTFAVHPHWTAAATLGVILGAAYMLWMIQRVFYGHLGPKPRALAAGIVLPDLGAREQISLWPLIILMLVMGVASPFWMRAIDSSGTQLADRPAVAAAPHVIVLSSATFAPPDSDTGATSAKGGK